MGGLFSRKKASQTPPQQQPDRITEQDKAVLSLKQQRDKMKQYQKKININMEKERSLAKQLVKDGKIEKAKLLLKKKIYQDNLLKKTDNQLEGIEKLIQDVEFAQVELKVVEGLKKGNEALKQIHQIMSIEDVERIMDETKEAVEYQQEIDALISGDLTEQDEEDILAELAELEELEKAAELPSVPDREVDDDDSQLPDVPTHEPVAKKAKEKTDRVAVAAT